MALTESEKTELKNDILNAIKAESQSVDELVEVSSLDNIKSLPALRGSELVSAISYSSFFIVVSHCNNGMKAR